jgi:hypothetical protein
MWIISLGQPMGAFVCGQNLAAKLSNRSLEKIYRRVNETSYGLENSVCNKRMYLTWTTGVKSTGKMRRYFSLMLN